MFCCDVLLDSCNWKKRNLISALCTYFITVSFLRLLGTGSGYVVTKVRYFSTSQIFRDEKYCKLFGECKVKTLSLVALIFLLVNGWLQSVNKLVSSVKRARHYTSTFDNLSELYHWKNSVIHTMEFGIASLNPQYIHAISIIYQYGNCK